MQCDEFNDQPNKYQFLKKQSASWRKPTQLVFTDSFSPGIAHLITHLIHSPIILLGLVVTNKNTFT